VTGRGATSASGDIIAAIREAGEPLTRKELVRILRSRRKPHGVGTIAKALADLTASGELVILIGLVSIVGTRAIGKSDGGRLTTWTMLADGELYQACIQVDPSWGEPATQRRRST
jgi:hypothetical protein